MQFENEIAEACWALYDYMPGAFSEFTDGQTRVHVLVDYSPVLLRNIAADQRLVVALARATNSREGTAWIVIDNDRETVLVKECGLTGRWASEVVDKFERRCEMEDAAS